MTVARPAIDRRYACAGAGLAALAAAIGGGLFAFAPQVTTPMLAWPTGLAAVAAAILATSRTGRSAPATWRTLNRRRDRRLIDLAIESIPNGLCVLDRHRRLMLANSGYGRAYGLAPQQLVAGLPLADLIDLHLAAAGGAPVDAAAFRAFRLAAADPADARRMVITLANGSIIEISRHPMADGGLVEVHKDVTDTHLAEARAEAARQELIERQYAIDQAVIVALTDVQGRIIYANDNFCRISGYCRDELLGQNHRLLKSGAHPPALFRDMYRQIARGRVWRGELCNRAKDGTLYWVDTVITPQLGADGRPVAYMAIRVDITARKRVEAALAHAALHDTLTGIANRAALLEQLDTALLDVRRHKGTQAILLLDLDGFKHVNDTLGHAAGDTLLRQLAGRITALLGDDAFVARLGGDEFAMLQASGADPRHDAGRLAQRVLEAMARPFRLEGQELVIGASIGIACAPLDGRDAGELLKKADLALYRVKSEGRNGYSFFDDELGEATRKRLRLTADMPGALQRHEFELHYQPLLDVGTRRPCGLEALVRWRHPQAGLLGPAEFIGLAEETGFMAPLGRWILRQACADAMTWPDHLRVAVNLSAAQFRTGDLVDTIATTLAETGLAPHRLELELTETLLLHNQERNVAAIHALKALGVGTALDDFGTGYASLSYLLMFPFDRIKIDRSFTQDLATRADCSAVVASILALARSLGIAVTAEGVETRTQFELLRGAGVDEMQGFLFGRPCPLSALDLAALMQIAQTTLAA
ncbi:MAG: EAL domain-containing protein [Pseudomonadota bacterium]